MIKPHHITFFRILDPSDLPVASGSPDVSSPNADDDDSEYAEESSFRPLYYLFDVDDSKALLFANVMKIDAQTDWGAHYRIHSGPSCLMAAILMLNILRYDCGPNKNVENAVKKLNGDEIKEHYQRVIDIFMASSEGTDSTEAKESRKEQLQEVEQAILQMAAGRGDEELEEDDVVLLEEDLEDLRRTGYRVEMPALHHTGIGCDLKRKEFPTPGQMVCVFYMLFVLWISNGNVFGISLKSH